MIKKVLSFIIVAFVSIQIPLMISLSVANKIGKKLEAKQEKVEKIAVATEVAGGLSSLLGDKVPGLKVLDTGGISSMLAKGQEGLEGALSVVGRMKIAFYVSLCFILLLLLLLFVLSKKLFFRYLGFSFVIGGILCLLYVALVYHLLILNFEKTFDYFAGGTGVSTIPFASGIMKSFSREFLGTIADCVITRNLVGTIIGLALGTTFIIKNNWLAKKLGL